SVPGWEEKLDVSVPRRDSKTGKGYTGFTVLGDPTMTIKEAADRRDLTMNTLAYDPLSKTILDPFGGINDIEDQIIRVTNPVTFQEDPLRVLRIAQFASRFGFSISQETQLLCAEMVARGGLEVSSLAQKGKSRKYHEDSLITYFEIEHQTFEDNCFLFKRNGELIHRKVIKKENDGLSVDRITKEFEKLLVKGTKPSIGLTFLKEIGS
ncbi:MAG: cca, partial [Candidatus Dadabacteria bacterium]|nr:cca [Candidatus Dadabacteria bacterium]